MKKNLPIYILLAFLLVVNGFFLYTHFNGSKKKKPRPPRDFIANQLNFNDEQRKQFDVLEDAHRKQMRVLSDELRELKDAFFNKISDSTISEKEIDSLGSLIAIKEKSKDMEVFKHLRKIREICNEEQREKFSTIVKDARKRGRKRHRRPPPRRD